MRSRDRSQTISGFHLTRFPIRSEAGGILETHVNRNRVATSLRGKKSSGVHSAGRSRASVILDNRYRKIVARRPRCALVFRSLLQAINDRDNQRGLRSSRLRRLKIESQSGIYECVRVQSQRHLYYCTFRPSTGEGGGREKRENQGSESLTSFESAAFWGS
jgi:hypothetical protein